MSIENYYGLHVASCDICHEAKLDGEHDFYDAVRAKKAAGWKSKKIDGEWHDICCDCQRRDNAPF